MKIYIQKFLILAYQEFFMIFLQKKKKDLSVSVPLGIPLYMAPELFSVDIEKYDQSIDVFSFGMVVYKILTGS